MPEPTLSTQEPINALPHPRLNKRRAMGVVGTLLLLAAACIVWYELAVHSRYLVIGITDPASGYRIEYTVSSRYRKGFTRARLNMPQLQETYSFAPNPPPQALEWIRAHILRRPAPGQVPMYSGREAGTIEEHRFLGDASEVGIAVDAHGYPELSYLRHIAAPPDRNFVEDHLLVSGCPATWYAYNLPGSNAPNPRYYSLIIKPKDVRVFYDFSGADDPVPTGMRDEIIKIRESIRISIVK